MASETTVAVSTSGLTKTFGNTRAVEGVSISVPRGSVFGLLGPNGAGKTTIVRMLATLLPPDAGTAWVFGHDVTDDPDAVRRRISVTGQFASIDKDLTGVENLRLQARLLGLSRRDAELRARELLEGFDLAEAASRQVKTYSGGMQRRLDVAASIVVTPDLLFLDEPTTGLDPRSRSQVWEVVRRLVARGTTVVLTTQYLDEADHLADRIAVVDQGRIVADDTPTRLKASIGAGVLRVQVSRPARRTHAQQVLTESLGAAVTAESDPSLLTARLADTALQTADEIAIRALAQLTTAGVGVASFALGQPSLDEVFLALTGHRTDNDRAAEQNNPEQNNAEQDTEENAA